MDFNILVGTIQLAIAAFQLKLDHFKTPANRQNNDELDNFYTLGEAIRALEYALAETTSYAGQTHNRQANPRLASLWEDASRSISRISNGADLADLTFQKNLYWRNPEMFRHADENRLYRISLDNVLNQLRKLRTEFEKLQNKINS